MPQNASFRFKVPIIFGLFLCFVWGAAVLLHQSEAEEKLIQEARARLQATNDLAHLMVSFDGSNGHLKGEVETVAMKQRAVYLVAEVQGVTAVNADAVRVRK